MMMTMRMTTMTASVTARPMAKAVARDSSSLSPTDDDGCSADEDGSSSCSAEEVPTTTTHNTNSHHREDNVNNRECNIY